MFIFPGIFHLLASLAAINQASGNHTDIPTPKKPKVFGFGWPNITLVTATVETIPIEGIVQYELFYNKTCPFVSLNDCSSALIDLSPVDGCRKVANQTSASAAATVSSCTICNSTEDCRFMGITKDDDLCLYLKVTTSTGSSHVCMERNYFYNILVVPPPKTIQLLATKKKQLTVLWEHPEGIDPSSGIYYQVILQDHLGKCKNNIRELKEYGEGSINFTGLSPWSNYSVTICCEMYHIPVNTAACTCGDYRHLPGGPVFNLTLPEEPRSQPSLLQPCEALCVDTNFSVILKWKASDNLIWNGIPTKSVINIYQWNSSSPDVARHDESKLGIPVATFSVPLGSNYNGSLVAFPVNLTSGLTYVATVKFCSNGGCGRYAVVTMSCDVCESLGLPGTLSGKPSPSPSAKSYWPEIGAGVSFFILTVAVVITVVISRKKRQRNRQSIQETIGNMQPENNYDYPDFADMTSDDGPYSQVYSSESKLLQMDNQTAQRV